MTYDTQELKSAIATIWKEAIENNRYHDAILVSVLGYLGSRIKGDSESEHEALALISATVDTIPRKQKIKVEACSFCGRRPPEVRLGGGGDNVYICDSCVKLFNQSFHEARN